MDVCSWNVCLFESCKSFKVIFFSIFTVKPLRVNILNKPKLLSADTEYAISCESIGSRPQAEITWWRENRRFRKGRVSTFI